MLTLTAAGHVFQHNQEMPYSCSGEPAPQSIGPLAKIPVPGAYTQTDGTITAKISPEAETFFRIGSPLDDTAYSRTIRLFSGRRPAGKRLNWTGIDAARTSVAERSNAEQFRTIVCQRQIGEDFRKSDSGSKLRCDHHLITTVFAQPCLRIWKQLEDAVTTFKTLNNSSKLGFVLICVV